jgi:hypothetical protein
MGGISYEYNVWLRDLCAGLSWFRMLSLPTVAKRVTQKRTRRKTCASLSAWRSTETIALRWVAYVLNQKSEVWKCQYHSIKWNFMKSVHPHSSCCIRTGRQTDWHDETHKQSFAVFGYAGAKIDAQVRQITSQYVGNKTCFYIRMCMLDSTLRLES